MKKGKLRRDLHRLMFNRLGDQVTTKDYLRVASLISVKLTRGRKRMWNVSILIHDTARSSTWRGRVEPRTVNNKEEYRSWLLEMKEVIGALVTEMQLKDVWITVGGVDHALGAFAAHRNLIKQTNFALTYGMGIPKGMVYAASPPRHVGKMKFPRNIKLIAGRDTGQMKVTRVKTYDQFTKLFGRPDRNHPFSMSCGVKKP